MVQRRAEAAARRFRPVWGNVQLFWGNFFAAFGGKNPNLAMFHVKQFCTTIGGKGRNEWGSRFGLIFVLTTWDAFATVFPGKWADQNRKFSEKV